MSLPGGWAPAAALVLSAGVAAQQPDAARLADTLARTSRQVERYYTRARTIVSTERVVIQPLALDLLPIGQGRRLVYELRVEWEPPVSDNVAGQAQVVRRLLTINGRPPGPGYDPGCIDPKLASPEPLAVFLPTVRPRYAFTWAGTDRTDGRSSVMLDFRLAMPDAPKVTWTEECVSLDVPAKTLGRVWVDADTGDVLRLDERFEGQFDVTVPWEHQRRGSPPAMTIERHDSSIRYRQVEFSNPPETLLLPATIDTLSIVRNAGSPRVRVTQTFSDYRRFTTASKLLE